MSEFIADFTYNLQSPDPDRRHSSSVTDAPLTPHWHNSPVETQIITLHKESHTHP
jgi:hypothetical protein